MWCHYLDARRREYHRSQPPSAHFACPNCARPNRARPHRAIADSALTRCCSYLDPEIALNTGNMLRECVRHEPLAKIVLHSDELFGKFFTFVQDPQFDIASDAFATFKVW